VAAGAEVLTLGTKAGVDLFAYIVRRGFYVSVPEIP
jgi:hypothetical protein